MQYSTGTNLRSPAGLRHYGDWNITLRCSVSLGNVQPQGRRGLWTIPFHPTSIRPATIRATSFKIQLRWFGLEQVASVAMFPSNCQSFEANFWNVAKRKCKVGLHQVTGLEREGGGRLQELQEMWEYPGRCRQRKQLLLFLFLPDLTWNEVH